MSTLLIAAFSISLASCGGGGGDTPPPPPPVTFSQADLTGTWQFNKLDAGAGTAAKWDRGQIDIDNGGAMTFSVFESSKIGDAAPTGLVITIHPATGIVSITDFPAFRGAMSTNKNIIVATIKEADAPSMLVLQKADPAATFTSADLADKIFIYQHIKAGAENDWEYGFGVTDSSGAVTLNTIYRPDPTTGVPSPVGGPVAIGTMSINSEGIVILDSNTSVRGVMSSDKNSLILTESDNPAAPASYTLTIVHMTTGGQTFSQADLTGPWNFGMLAASATGAGGWIYGTASVAADGAVSFPAWAQIDQGMPPTGVTFTLSSYGILLEPVSNPTTYGVMSFGKDFVVLTTTMDATSGVYALGVMVRGTQAVVQDAAAMNPMFDTLETLYAATQPTDAELDNWFSTHVASDFLMDGMDGATLLTALKAGQGPQVGMTLSAAVDVPIDVAGYGKGYNITLWNTSGGITESLPTKAVFDGTRWRWYGNQQWAEARVRPRAEMSVQYGGATTYTTWLEPEVSDNTNYAYNLGVRSAVVVGPGLPAAGLGIDIYGGSGNMYQLTDDNIILAIPNYAEYTIALCSEPAAAIVADPSLCTPLQTYTYAIGKRPLTNVEAAAASYPALTQPTTHTLSDLTGTWGTGSVTITWTNPPQMEVEWAGLMWSGGNAHNENLTGLTSTTLTVTDPAPTDWATIYMGGLDSDGRIFSLIWGFGP